MTSLFAVVQCSECRKPRIVDLSTKMSSCPSCGNTDAVDELRVIVRTRTQENARKELTKLTSARMMVGFDGKVESPRPKHARRSTDPWSTLERDYESAKGLESKMRVMSEGLTRVCGEFTEEDVLRLDPEKGARMLEMMLDTCLVHETSYGHYKA